MAKIGNGGNGSDGVMQWYVAYEKEAKSAIEVG